MSAELLAGLVVGALALRRPRRRMADASGSGGVRVERVGGWTWVTAPASSLGAKVGGDAVDARRGPLSWVACGPMFDREGPRFLVRDPVTGTDVPSRETGKGATVCVTGGQIGVQLGAGVAGCRVAVQGYPALVYRGRRVDVADSERARRVALAVMADDRVGLIGGYGTMEELGRAARARGVRVAVYLDGGRAAHLASATETVWEHTAAERPASWIVLG